MTLLRVGPPSHVDLGSSTSKSLTSKEKCWSRGQTNLDAVGLPEIEIARPVRHQRLNSATRSDDIIVIAFRLYVTAAGFVHPPHVHCLPQHNNYLT